MPAPEAPAQGDLDNYGSKPAAAPTSGQKKQAWDIKRIALNIAKDCEGPALVRFINTASLDPRSEDGRITQKATMNSASLLAVWESNNRTGDPVACALTKYCFEGRFSMEVSKVTREECAIVNRENAPFLVAMSAKNASGERACIEVLDGKIQAPMAVAEMRAALKKVNLDKVGEITREFDKNMAAVDTYQSQIKQKQDMISQAKSPDRVAQLEAQVAEIEKSLQAAQAKLDACKAQFTAMHS